MKTDAAAGLSRRLHQLADGFEDCSDFVVVLAETFFEFHKFEGQLVLLSLRVCKYRLLYLRVCKYKPRNPVPRNSRRLTEARIVFVFGASSPPTGI